jgi:hypothetical protein
MIQTPKKSNRKVTVALAGMCIITLVALNISIITYYQEINDRNKKMQILNDQIDALETEIAKILNATAASGAPRLISIGLQYNDDRTNPNSPFLEVTGYIVNVGGAKANNCTFHVIAIQSENRTAVDTSTTIKSLEAGTYQRITIQFPYAGEPLWAYSSSLDWKA